MKKFVYIIIAIVLIIIAYFSLYLITMFKDIDVPEPNPRNIRDLILEDLKNNESKKLSFPTANSILNPGSNLIVALGVKNINKEPLNYNIKMEVIEGNNSLRFVYDTSSFSINSGEVKVHPIRISSSGEAKGTYLAKITVTNTDTSEVYAEKTFEVTVN